MYCVLISYINLYKWQRPHIEAQTCACVHQGKVNA